MRSTQLEQLARPGKKIEVKGVRVVNVGEKTPAEVSGLRPDDIILKINDWEVIGDDLVSDVAKQIQKHSPTTSISLLVKRGEKFLDISRPLGALPVPSARARTLRKSGETLENSLPSSLQLEITAFQAWLSEEIEKDRKNLIADRRL